jgi:predicted Zn finger-like uncharacterized protein
MRATCPACATTYAIPAELAGRRLRCAICGAVFHAAGEAAAIPPLATTASAMAAGPLSPSPADAAPAEANGPATDAATAPPVAERLGVESAGSLSAAPRLAWAASLLVVAAALLALYVARAEIAAAWPPMLRLYRALGLL